ncbi:MAG: hypothetical protein ACXVYU_15990 [Oryzihumus sp.]
MARRATVRRVLGTGAVIVLLVVDVALVALALQRDDPTPATPTPVVTLPDPTDEPDPVGSPVDVTPTASPSTAEALAPAPLTRLVVALDATHAWRVEVGACTDGGSAVATSADGGKTWVARLSPLRTITRLRASSAQAAFVIGADATCSAAMRTTTDSGQTWTGGAGLDRSWFRDPASTVVIHTSRGRAVRPCQGGSAVIDLLPASTTRATVLCGDGQVRSSGDSGSTWTASGSATHALAAASDQGTDTWVARPGADQGCAGITIVRASRPTAVVGCAVVSLAGVSPGSVALSAAGSSGWLLVGDRTLRSSDGLKTWHAVGS